LNFLETNFQFLLLFQNQLTQEFVSKLWIKSISIFWQLEELWKLISPECESLPKRIWAMILLKFGSKLLFSLSSSKKSSISTVLVIGLLFALMVLKSYAIRYYSTSGKLSKQLLFQLLKDYWNPGIFSLS